MNQTATPMVDQLTDLPQQEAMWFEEEFSYTQPRRGEIRKATILDIGASDILVDLGSKRDGVVPPRDLELLDDSYRASLQVGDQVPVAVLFTQGHQGELVVSINKGLQQADWLRVQNLMDNGETIEAEVSDVNKGGVAVSVGRLRGFVPNSHLSSIPRGIPRERLQEAKSELIGTTLWLVVLEVNQQRRRLVLSEREATRHRRATLLDTLTEGEIHTGTVRSLVPFGAFVDMGGIDGLIHISELDWKHVHHPQEVVSVGDKVDVYILDIDRERERIGLSRKRLIPDPWPAITENMSAGDIFQGTVTNIASFGAFVDVGEGVEGLVHVSEMPNGEETRSSLQTKELVWVQVQDIDDTRHRISLTMHVVGWSETPPLDTETADQVEPEQNTETTEHDPHTEGNTT